MKLQIHISSKQLSLNIRPDFTVRQLYHLFNLSSNDLSLISQRYAFGQHVHLTHKLLGGKGGFIAQLKKEGAAMKKSDNKDKLRSKNNKTGKTEKLLKSLKEAQKQPVKDAKPKRIPKEPKAKPLLKEDNIDNDRKHQEELFKKLFNK
eukprot:NODE_627_length_5881_cov_0.181771.p4 type:complete len:148 gc:universal NODE_627_length_5881_cov_0.181771:749-1192(+)